MAHRKTMVAIVRAGDSQHRAAVHVGRERTSCRQTISRNSTCLVRTPEGTSLAATTNLAERIAQDIRALPGVQHTLTDRRAAAADRSRQQRDPST